MNQRMDLTQRQPHSRRSVIPDHFFSGEALSIAPSVGALTAGSVKTIQIDVVDRVIEIAPGVHFNAWTFGGHVPGPIVHARVGRPDPLQHDQPQRRADARHAVVRRCR